MPGGGSVTLVPGWSRLRTRSFSIGRMATARQQQRRSQRGGAVKSVHLRFPFLNRHRQRGQQEGGKNAAHQHATKR